MTDIDPQITLVAETDSTNELALAAIDDGQPEGTTFVADRQTAGRGRREGSGSRRVWFSPPHKNLYFSTVARPDVDVKDSAAITVAVGVELVEWLRETTGVEVELKWPNDLYVGMKKLGGILTEGVAGAEGLGGIAIGVGLNVNVEPAEFPDQLRDGATSLVAETDRRYDRLGLALSAPGRVVSACATYAAEGLEAYADRLERYDWLSGRRVAVRDGGQMRGAIARSVGSSGGLCVEFDDGTSREIISGEVTVEALSGTEEGEVR